MTIIDCLVRAGASVCVASVGISKEVVCSRGVKITADAFIDECKDFEWDLIALPGGMPGATHLRASTTLCDMLIAQNRHEKLLGAICASPAVVLECLGILKDAQATCYPAPRFRQVLPNFSEGKVVIDKHIVTSQGPATSMEFALALIRILFGEEKCAALTKELLF